MSARDHHALQDEQAYRQRVDLALDTAHIGTWEWDPEADRVTWSENFERVHGFERGAFGTSLAAYSSNIHTDDRERVIASLRACAAGGPAYRVEYRLLAPGGFLHHVEASGCRVADPPHADRLIGVCRDVSDRVDLLERERGARRDAETSELHYRTLAAAIPQQVWTATPDGALDFVNQRAVEYFGRPAADVIGDGWQAVIHPADLPGVIARWQHALAAGEEYEVEFRLRSHDGQYRWHLGRAIPVRDAAGTVLRWLGTNTDIDETKRMLTLMSAQIEVAHLLINARSLEQVAEALLETVCRNLGWTCAQLWVADHVAGVLNRTAGWCGTDCNLDELATFDRLERGIGLPGRIWDTASPAWIEDVRVDPNFPRAGLLRRLGLRSALGFPLIVGGTVSAVLELFSRDQRPPDQTVVNMIATFGSQIGQFILRIHAENQLSDALDRLKRLQGVTDVALSHLSLSELLDNLLPKIRDTVACDVVVVWLLDEARDELYPASMFGSAFPLRPDTRIKIGESLGGLAALERKTKTVRNATSQEFISPPMRALGIESLAAVPLICRERLLGVLVVGARADIAFAPDEIGFVELVAQRLANAIDNASRYEDARESIRMKDRFLSIASHELKTPMTGILGWTTFLRGETDPALRDEALESIEQSARAQARLIEDLLDSARIRAGKIVLRHEVCDLSAIVDAAVRTMTATAEERGVIVEAGRPDGVALYGDASRLQQVVMNLLGNAIKFTPAGKRVRVWMDAHRNGRRDRRGGRGRGHRAGVPAAHLQRLRTGGARQGRGRSRPRPAHRLDHRDHARRQRRGAKRRAGTRVVVRGAAAAPSVSFQQKPLEVFALGAVERHRMIGAGGETPDDGDAAAGVERGGEDHFLEEVERHVAAAGEGHHQAARLEQLHGEEVDVLVAARGAIDLAARLGKRGGVADDEVEALVRLADVLEGVGDDEAGLEAVQLVVGARRLDGRRGDVDVLHRRRAARRRVDAERAAVGEEVQRAAAAGQRASERAIVALVEEEAGLLP